MKALTLALCILALLGSAASGYFWWQIGESNKLLKEELSSEQTRAAGIQSRLSQTTEELDAEKAKLAASDAELGDTKTKLTTSEARNVQAAREIAGLKTSVAAQEATEKKLIGDLDTLRRELVQTRVAASVGNPEEVERYKQTIASLESRLNELAGGQPAEVAANSVPSGPVLSERTAAARVASVGVKDAFVVLELNSSDGVSVGQKFTITRVGETLANATISNVTEAYAIAQISPVGLRGPLKTGDIASLVP
jgi:hypothetical protein